MAKRKGFTGYRDGAGGTVDDIQGANWGGRLRAFTIPDMVVDTQTGAEGSDSEASMSIEEQSSPARSRAPEKG